MGRTGTIATMRGYYFRPLFSFLPFFCHFRSRGYDNAA